MFSEDLIGQLAAELHESEKSRVQIEHFSKRYPGMTIEDGYAISKAWVKMKLSEGTCHPWSQDRPDLACDAAGKPNHRTGFRHLA